VGGTYLIVTPIKPRVVQLAVTPDAPEDMEWWVPRKERSMCGVGRDDWQQAVWALEYQTMCERCMQRARGVKKPKVSEGGRYIH
jgi:hypothetical protein